ncbi:MAG: HD domain-containing protein [Candidatus Thermoplasmatota archaeon]|nr:HD domain-containing protein [Candidatus Thermoplasmatota archaeon]
MDAKLLELFREAGKLKRLNRKGWEIRDIPDPESVADHSFRMAFMAMVVGERLGLDSCKMMKMALIHDLGEARIGDITPHDRVSSSDKRRMEEEAVRSILEGLEGDYLELWLEFEDGKSPEAKLVKDLDRLEMCLQALEYQELFGDWDGSEFLDGAEEAVGEEQMRRLLLLAKSLK